MISITKPEGWQDATKSELAKCHASIRFTPKIGQVIEVPKDLTIWKRPILDGEGNVRRRDSDKSKIFAFYLVCKIDERERPIPMGAFNQIPSEPEERAGIITKSPLMESLVNASDDEDRLNNLIGKKIKAVDFFNGHGPDWAAGKGPDGRYPTKETKFTVWDFE